MSVEGAFSALISALTDRRLKMSHKTLKIVIHIYSNDMFTAIILTMVREGTRGIDIKGHLHSSQKEKMS